jgi:hypothetical protein
MCGLWELNRGVESMSRSRPPDDFRAEESPIAWFGELLIAIDRGDFQRAAESQQQLDRLGWCVNPKSKETRPTARGQRGKS